MTSSAPLMWAFLVNSVPFTRDVIDGRTSLGGSESACLGVARALAARGHQVHLFTTQIDPDCVGTADAAGVVWHDLGEFWPMNRFIEWDVVVSLRAFQVFGAQPVYARLRILWNQDLLVPGDMQGGVMSTAWAYDQVAYVSPYHRAQWEQLQPELSGLGWVTRNSFDPADLPTAPTRDPNRVIYTSRPERGLGPLLQMWPALREAHPEATLQVCRYSSMYDQGPGSWSDVCESWDRRLTEVNEEIGGITYLGELTKPQLYEAISGAAVMWYPGVETFAETGCLAAIEAQACGTPFVGSYRGALPGVVVNGHLVRGETGSQAYREESVAAVAQILRDGVTAPARQAGVVAMRAHHHETVAEEWEQRVELLFAQRVAAHPMGVLRKLLHDDDHVAARTFAQTVQAQVEMDGFMEAQAAITLCDRVIAGQDHTAEQYGEQAIDPHAEMAASPRVRIVVERFEGQSRVLDVACGNGAFAVAMAMAHPELRVVGLDYSAANIAVARQAATDCGVADRCEFQQVTVYDFDAHELHADWWEFLRGQSDFDGLFVGEFIEHLENTVAVVDGLEDALAPGARVVYTCPHGAMVDLLSRRTPHYRGHVHRFHYDDLHVVFGDKASLTVEYLEGGNTPRGEPIGNWIVQYERMPGREARPRPISDRIARTRPMPMLSVGIIAYNAEADIVRCLESLYGVADEIVIGDTGSTDATRALAEAFSRTTRVIDVEPVQTQEDGFAGARNDVLAACRGDWFLWIDTDEVLIRPHTLRRYLEGSVFQGYVLQQTHLYLDGPPTWDIPVRVFRKVPSVRFYGCIHEQPQDGDSNTNLHPTLEVMDVKIAHFGYLVEETREHKRLSRNLPLLKRDAERFDDRVLGKVLLIREAVLESDRMRAQAGRMTDRARQGYAYAIQMFMEHFSDLTHHLTSLARPWYEAALQHLGIGWEQEIALAGRLGGLEGRHARPERIWVRDADEFRQIVEFKANALAEGMRPVTFVTDPDELLSAPAEARAVEAAR